MIPINTPRHCKECGGCEIARESIETSTRKKTQKVIEHFPGTQLFQGSTYSYRRRAYFRARIYSNTPGLYLGFFRHKTREFLKIDFCPILETQLNDFISLCEQTDFKYQGETLKLRLRVDSVSYNQGLGLSIFIEGYEEDLLALKKTASILRSFPHVSAVKIRGDNSGVNRVDRIQEVANEISYYHCPGDFSQVNAQINGRIRQIIFEICKSKGVTNVAELFSGNGNFSLPLIKAGISVIGFEASKTAVQCANRSAKELTQREGYEPYHYRDLFKQPVDVSGFDLLIVDPPRAGIGKVKVIGSPSVVLYISCCFESFMDDYQKWFLPNRYEVSSLQGFDMMPHTYHIEILAVLVQKRSI